MQVKSYNHQSIAQWSNSKIHSQLIACAQINPDSYGFYNLDILSLDLSDRSKNLNVMGNAYYNAPFRCLAWDTYGQKQNNFSHGVIFGGMEDGSFTLWDAGQMILNYGRNNTVKNQQNLFNQPAFIYDQNINEDGYPIMCAQWNSLKNNYLAFGSTQLLILDIGKDISSPQLNKAGNRNPHQGSYITSVSWNRQVANILASASQNGLIALWDIKSNKSIFQFKDSPSSNVGNRNVVICWSKTISTQLAVTLDDQKRNQLQIWDLRNQKGPVAVFDRGHTKGINTMQWCQTDPDLILTAGRDNRIVCWNYTQQQAPISTQQLNQPIFDLKWSKKLKSIYSLSLQDRTQIYTMDNTNLFSYVPKWYRVPIESSFLGNESLIKYSQNQGQKLTQVKLCTLPQTPVSSIHKLLKQLQAALDQNPFQQKNKQNQFWNLISIKNSNQGDDGIYDFLGFNKQKIIKEVQKYTGKKRGNDQVKTQTQTKTKSKAYTPVLGQEAASFFASIGQSQLKNSGPIVQDDQQHESVKYDMVPRNFNWNIGKQRLIKHNILIGNYQGAIDAALKLGRTAEALIIAYSLDQNTFNSTLKTFFTETTDNFITDILKNITYRDNEQLVRKYDLQSWKQCVAMIYSLATGQKRKALLNLLASRIRQESLRNTGKNNHNDILSEDDPAIQCYVLSQNFNEIANLYFDNLKKFESGTLERKQTVLQYAKRLILVFSSLSIEIQPCKNFHKIIRQAAFIATQQNFKMVSYLLFSNFIYESSMKEVDMIIHATKNLQEYRNSVVFKQINIPVMQMKDNNQQQPQKGKKPVQDHNPQKGSQGHPPTNPNVPTKDKNVPRPPIFNKREQQKEVFRGNIAPPQSSQNRPRTQTQTYQEQEQVQVVPKKSTVKKVPPPGNFKAPQRLNEPVSYNQSQYQQQAPTQTLQKKNVPPPSKNKRMPPPPPGFVTQQRQQPTLIHKSQQVKKMAPKPPQSMRTPPPPAQEVKTSQHQSYQQNRMPPPPSKGMKIPPPPTSYRQQQDEYQQQQTQPISRNQQYPHQPHVQQQKSVKPPPPSQKNMPPPPPVKQHIQREDHNTSFHSRGGYEQPQYNKPPQVHTVKKNMPPPPPIAKRQVSYQQEEQTVNSRTRIQSVKPPPPQVGKVGNKIPPPPSKVQQPPQQVMRPPTQQIPSKSTIQYPAQQNNYYAQQQQEQPERPTQYETPVIKRPPPPVTGKKGPPPPPRR